MNPRQFAQNALNRPRTARIVRFLQTTPASDPRRQRVEQLLDLARNRRDAQKGSA